MQKFVFLQVKVYFSEVGEREKPVSEIAQPVAESTNQNIKPPYEGVNCDDASRSSNQMEMKDKAPFGSSTGSSLQKPKKKPRDTNQKLKPLYKETNFDASTGSSYQRKMEDKTFRKVNNDSSGYQTEEEDDAMSDTDNEETWEQEGTLV